MRILDKSAPVGRFGISLTDFDAIFEDRQVVTRDAELIKPPHRIGPSIDHLLYLT
jgi:hypothetical protein